MHAQIFCAASRLFDLHRGVPHAAGVLWLSFGIPLRQMPAAVAMQLGLLAGPADAICL